MGWEQPKGLIPAFNVKKRVCWRGFNRSVHEAMKNILKVKVHFKTRSENVNIAY